MKLRLLLLGKKLTEFTIPNEPIMDGNILNDYIDMLINSQG